MITTYHKTQNGIVKNRGEIFKHNPALQYMTVTDRAIFILNHFGVKMSQWEYIGLRLTDGMYEEANKSYYMSYNPDWGLKSNMHTSYIRQI